MPLLENLAEGFANAAGDQNTVNSIENRKFDRQATAHEELHAKTQSILDDVRRLQDRRATLPAGSPELASIDKSLADHQQAFTDLYHPDKNPGALQHLGGFIKQHLTGQKPQIPATPGQAKASMAQLQASAAGTAVPDPYLTPDELRHKARIDAGLDPRAIEKPPKYQAQLTTTQDAEGKLHYWRVPLEPGQSPEEVDFNGQAVQQKGTAPKVGSFGDFMTAAYGPHPTPQQYEQGRAAWAKAAAGTTVGTHIIQVPQPDGSIKAFEVTTTSTKTFPGVGGQPSGQPAKTPKDFRRPSPAASSDSGRVKPGATLGGKLTAPQSKAKTEYDESVGLASIADQVAQKPDDAINQKRLAVALERASAGRFTTQALDYIIKAGWGNTIETWANSTTTGALPADIMRQLVDGAHQNMIAKKAALDASGYRDSSSNNTGGTTTQFQVPAGAPAAPKEDGHKLKANGTTIAVSKGGQWVAP